MALLLVHEGLVVAPVPREPVAVTLYFPVLPQTEAAVAEEVHLAALPPVQPAALEGVAEVKGAPVQAGQEMRVVFRQ